MRAAFRVDLPRQNGPWLMELPKDKKITRYGRCCGTRRVKNLRDLPRASSTGYGPFPGHYNYPIRRMGIL